MQKKARLRRSWPGDLAYQTQTVGKPMSLGNKFVIRACAIGSHLCNSSADAVVHCLDTLARGIQHCFEIRIRSEDRRWMRHGKHYQQNDGYLKRPKCAIHPS